jgi:hypothetical protein
MLKQTQTYTDYDGVEQTDVLHFNLTKTEMLDIMELQPRLQAWDDLASGPERELTIPEVKELIDIVKYVIEKSFGIRSEDGKRFVKNETVYTEFTQSAVYDEFVFGLFNPPERAIEFITGLIPKDLREEAVKAAGIPETVVELPQAAEGDSRPAWLREGRQPTKVELANMSKEELQLAFQYKTASGE